MIRGLKGTKKTNGRWLKTGLMLAGISMIARRLLVQLRMEDIQGRSVLITGGSRGLGLLLAREFGREGCRVTICARDEHELELAQDYLRRHGITNVLTLVCDVADPVQVDDMIDSARQHFGSIDILVNNAGVIQVGPVKTMTRSDYEQAMDIMFWGVFNPTMSVLPNMLRRNRGHIVNITSIAGKVSVPRLLPYVAAKFAATGFSEGLTAELAGKNIKVTTIIPGLMRTGSFLNAFFKGHREDEFVWFGLGSALPLITIDAERAARQIVRATRLGETERIISVPANILTRFYGLFPARAIQLFGLANQLILPSSASNGKTPVRGLTLLREINSPTLNTLLTWGLSAARRFNQYTAQPEVHQKNVQRNRRKTGCGCACRVYCHSPYDPCNGIDAPSTAPAGTLPPPPQPDHHQCYRGHPPH